MELEKIIEKVYALGVIPVIKIDNADDAVPLADALCARRPAGRTSLRCGVPHVTTLGEARQR